MVNLDHKTAYIDHVANLEAELASDDALREAVGGNFIAVGKLEYHLLRSLGLTDGQLVVDVGCGSGRLAVQLAPYPGINYIGSDVVPRLLDYARNLTKRSEWKFVVTDGNGIPCEDQAADFTVFFSVFTHLLHEESFKYILEANRCLKLGGLLVFSFLEFRIPCHWDTFLGAVKNAKQGSHLTQFLDRDAIRVWAENSGFKVESISDGDSGHIPIPEEIRMDSGARMGTLGNMGQSVAILRKVKEAAKIA